VHGGACFCLSKAAVARERCTLVNHVQTVIDLAGLRPTGQQCRRGSVVAARLTAPRMERGAGNECCAKGLSMMMVMVMVIVKRQTK